MALTFRNLHPVFVGEASPIELRAVHDEEILAEIRAGMDKYAVLVFRDQPFEDAEQLAFAQRLDGKLHEGTGSRVIAKNRFGNEALSDISNVDAEGELMKADDRRRHYTLGNRLWHTDASFKDPAGRYSMLHARVVPPVAADTEFADMRAAYDTLPAETKALIEGLRTHHSIAHSRQILGFEFSQSEQDQLKGAVHPLVRTIPRSLAPFALPGVAPDTDSRLAAARGASPAARSDGARDPARVRLSSRLACRRSRDLGQPRDDAPGAAIRRHEVSP